MIQLVALDTGPLGLLTHPRPSPEAVACARWLNGLLTNGTRVLLPAIADYELRREYELRRQTRALQKLDILRGTVEPLSLSDLALRRAAALWAQSRQSGQPTSHPKSLDADCILVAQVRIVVEATPLIEAEWSIATTDVGDLSRLAPAARWVDVI